MLAAFVAGLFSDLATYLASKVGVIVSRAIMVLVAIGCILGLWYLSSATVKVLFTLLVLDSIAIYLAVSGTSDLLASLLPVVAPAKPAPKKS